MKKATKVEKILSRIDWSLIHHYHMKLNILWDIENDKGTVETKIPAISDIKNELSSLLNYMKDNGLDYISYGNWIIFFDDNTIDGEVRVIFKLADYVFTMKKSKGGVHIPFEPNDKSALVKLQEQLDNAVEEENYELAAKLRDRISKIDKMD